MGWTWIGPALFASRISVTRTREIVAVLFDWLAERDEDMFDVPSLRASYAPLPSLPEPGAFLLFADPSSAVVAPSSSSSSSSSSPLVAESGLPAELSGMPVFMVGGERVVLVAHVLARVLSCQCRANRHFGLFKDKKHIAFRRSIDASGWRYETHYSTPYVQYRDRYPLLRLKDQCAAITLEGLLKWAGSKMAVFVRNETAKCRQGCVEGKCTCRH